MKSIEAMAKIFKKYIKFIYIKKKYALIFNITIYYI